MSQAPFQKMLTQTRSGGSTAFTLIELVSVMLIISILASLVLPVLTKARGHARSAICSCNLKQLCLGVLMYKDDNSDYFPSGDRDAGATLTNRNAALWHRQIFQYLNVKTVYACPAALGKPHEFLSGPLDYSANAHVVRPHLAMPASVVPNPTIYVLLHDTSRSIPNFQWNAEDFRTAGIERQALSPAWNGITRHNGRMLVAFVDGHVSPVRIAVSQSADPPGNLGELGDSISGTPLWQALVSGTRAFLRRSSDE